MTGTDVALLVETTSPRSIVKLLLRLTGTLDRPFAVTMSVRFGEGDDAVLLIDQREVTP